MIHISMIFTSDSSILENIYSIAVTHMFPNPQYLHPSLCRFYQNSIGSLVCERSTIKYDLQSFPLKHSSLYHYYPNFDKSK